MKHKIYSKLLNNEFQFWELFEKYDFRFLKCREKYTEEFMQTYNQGFEAYLSGDWEKAKLILEKAEEILEEEDLPIRILLDFMNNHEFKKPLEWTGARIINDFY